jgi:PAS domain S-box-containing protein
MLKQKLGAGDTVNGELDDEIRPGRPPLRQTAPLIAALALIVPLLLGSIILLQGRQFERDAFTSLEITAQLKAQLVESWLADRRGDGKLIAVDADLIERSAALQRKANAGHKEVLHQRLGNLLEAYPAYSAAFLLDPQGEVLLAVHGQSAMSEQTRTLLPKVLASGEIAQSDFYIDPSDGLPSLNFVVPLRRQIAGRPQAVAALVLHTEPYSSMFPLLLTWSSASPSGETLLVRREGDSVIYINPLRHVRDTALKLTRPLADSQLPAAISIRTGAGTARGRDYRGVDVLAAYRPVAGTDWHVVAKLDHAEVMAPLWKLVTWVALVALAGILGIALLLRRYWAQRERLHQMAARARHMQSLHENEARFRAVAETARDAIVTAGADGAIIAWNPAATRMFGFAADEIIGQPLTLIVPPRFHQRTMDGFYRMLNGDPDSLDGRIAELLGYCKDGAEILLDCSVAVWETAAGHFYTCTMRDISERRRIEEQLRLRSAALEASANAIVITDAAGAIEWANPAFCTMSGYRLDEALGRNLRQLVKSGLVPIDVYQDLWHTLRAGQVWRGELTNRRKDGSHYLEDQTITPLREADGTVRHFISIKQDITERKRTEALLAERENELRVVVEEARDRLAAFAGEQNRSIEAERKRLAREVHDQIGQVFTAIKLIINSIPRDAFPPGQEAALAQALDIGIATTRKITSELRPPLLDDLGFAAALDYFSQASATLGNLSCEVDIDAQAVLDASQRLVLFRIAQEAMTNILRHAGATHVVITGRKDGTLYVFCIEDDGGGFASADHRVGSMGLMNMRERARLLGGSCEISPGPLGGTLVTVTLPLGDNVSDEHPAA